MTKIKQITNIQNLENLVVGDVVRIGYVFPEGDDYSDEELRVFEGVFDKLMGFIDKKYSFIKIKPDLKKMQMHIESLRCLESSFEVKDGIMYVDEVNCDKVTYEAGSYKHRQAQRLLQTAGQWKSMRDYKKEATRK